MKKIITNIYEVTDSSVLPGFYEPKTGFLALQTLDDLLERDKQREADGFPRRIRLGKIVKNRSGNKHQVVVVPTTSEPKFYHDNSVTEDEEEQTGGSGEGQEGEVIGEQPAQQQEGEGTGAGHGDSAEHEIGTDAFDLGKILTEKFHLPNLKDKGRKKSFSKFTYDLTDKNRGFGQVLDKKSTLTRIVKTNILLGNVNENADFTGEDLLINPQDHIYKILSREKDFENQAVVFFLRDYSGSMQGKPTEVVCTQHLFIYSWLVYQYSNNVVSRFILHDNQAKEVPDFETYYKSQVAGGTNIYPAFELVNKIIEEEQLARDYNIYVFHGTDGDDWDEDGKQAIENIKKLFPVVSRIGITVAKNSWGLAAETAVERYINKSGILKDKPNLIKMDVIPSDTADEKEIINGIKALTG